MLLKPLKDTALRRWVSVAEFAKELDCSDTVVFLAVQQGHIKASKLPDGRARIDILSQRAPFLQKHPNVLAKLKQNMDKNQLAALEKMEREKQEDAMALELNSMGIDAKKDLTTGESLAVIKVRKERAVARKAEVAAAQAEGSVVDLATMQTTWRDIAVRVRKAVMTIPDRVAPIMMGVKDQHEAHKILTNELRYALKSLGEDLIEEYERIEDAELEESIANASDSDTDGEAEGKDNS